MNCPAVRDLLGPYLDDELPEPRRAALEAHLGACRACTDALKDLQALIAPLSEREPTAVPEALWPSISERLDHEVRTDSARTPDAASAGPISRGWMLRRPWATAAGIFLLVGLGLAAVSWLGGTATPAQAAELDFRVLLDALPLDAKKAFRKFLIQYDARESTAHLARTTAAHLDFAIPETLPGGFHLDQVYLLRFGSRPGAAAAYVRGGEFLATIFHTPVRQGDYGGRRDYPCVVGQHRGHKVEVGQWKLVHLTDETTCRCVLSRLDEHEELPAILTAIVPGTDPSKAADKQ
ncbi:MAG: hypothetical protein GY778_00450 [bacterium]|nr:hypothetical protein [bacterium]